MKSEEEPFVYELNVTDGDDEFAFVNNYSTQAHWKKRASIF